MPGDGFELPQGDPAALAAAASSWRALGEALVAQGTAVTAAARTALGAGNWEGSAAQAFTGSSERLIHSFGANADACGQAADALAQLGQDLQHVQQVVREAQAECETAQSEAGSQDRAAAQAGQAAQAAQHAAAGSVHPATTAAFARQEQEARGQQSAAEQAAGQARGRLAAATSRAQQAISAYEDQARAVAARLNAAADQLKGAGGLGEGWADNVVNWIGHANDFGGAGATALVKSYDSAIDLAGTKMVNEAAAYLKDPTAQSSQILEETSLPFSEGQGDPVWDIARSAESLASNPVTRALTAHPSEDTVGLLGKVPYLAYGLTALDMVQHRNDGVGQAIVQPVGNLATGTAITEGVSSVVAPAVTDGAASLAAGDGLVATLAGTAFVPGVGEFVIVGGAAVLGTYAVDKGAEWVWDHRGAIVSDAEQWGSDALHAGGTVLHGAEHVVHDIEPWNW